MFILSCSAVLAVVFSPFAAGQSVPPVDRGERASAPRPEMEYLQVALLIRQMVLDHYDSTGTGILSDQDKARLVEDAHTARRDARKEFLRQFDKDGDGKLSPEEYKAFREHVEKRRGARRPDAEPGKKNGGSFSHPGERREFLPPPPPGEGGKMPLVEIRTAGQKRFKIAPGLFLLTRNMLMRKYDTNKNGRIDPEEHAVIMKDASALYQARMKELMELYDLDQDGVLSPVEREQALAANSAYTMDEPDDIDLFIRANISEVLLKESPVEDSGAEKGQDSQ